MANINGKCVVVKLNDGSMVALTDDQIGAIMPIDRMRTLHLDLPEQSDTLKRVYRSGTKLYPIIETGAFQPTDTPSGLIILTTAPECGSYKHLTFGISVAAIMEMGTAQIGPENTVFVNGIQYLAIDLHKLIDGSMVCKIGAKD